MNILLFGAAGFIGTNLTLSLSKNPNNKITLVDVNKDFFHPDVRAENVSMVESPVNQNADFKSLFRDQDVIYHLVSTTVPTTSNQQVADELTANVVMTARLLDACVSCGVQKVVFISSGGTVYGKESRCPLKEETQTNPITSYGVQKLTIEKLLYLYNYMYGLDYRAIRLANPYGPYQRPNGILGAVTTFTYKALNREPIFVYGDGSVVRDFIYIDDAVRGILTIADGDSEHKTFNLGSGYGTSICQVLDRIQSTLQIPLDIVWQEGRKVDVPVNFLDITRYEMQYGPLNAISMQEGIRKTAEFMMNAGMCPKKEEGSV
jgi:UDP-glucose 4-epimerase